MKNDENLTVVEGTVKGFNPAKGYDKKGDSGLGRGVLLDTSEGDKWVNVVVFGDKEQSAEDKMSEMLAGVEKGSRVRAKLKDVKWKDRVLRQVAEPFEVLSEAPPKPEAKPFDIESYRREDMAVLGSALADVKAELGVVDEYATHTLAEVAPLVAAVYSNRAKPLYYARQEAE